MTVTAKVFMNGRSQAVRLRTTLEKKGTPIGAMDMLIAAHARSLKAVLVTNDLHRFTKVPGLKVEGWS